MFVDEDKAKALLTEVVAENGRDHSVIRCLYIKNDQPHCIVGKVLAKVIPLEHMYEIFDNPAVNGENFNDDNLLAALRSEGVEFSENAVRILLRAQDVQDDGGTGGVEWGYALDAALLV